MIIIIFFIIHWYTSLFFQTFFNHRYAAHGMFTMSRFWEKVFYILSWITNGSSFLSPNTYGILHRMHHAFADKEKDPHSPLFSPNPFALMMKTRTIYSNIWYRKIPLEKRFTEGVPEWKFMDVLGESNGARLAWTIAYIVFYAFFVGSQWWLWLLLPLTMVMGPLHGVIINWFAHKLGYTNFKVSDTSKNLLPVDLFMMGESYHNNHHKRPDNANFGYRWFELDPVYPFILLFDLLGIIKLKKKGAEKPVEFKFTAAELEKVKAEYTRLNLGMPTFNLNPEAKFKQCVEAWDAFVKKDWQEDVGDYLSQLKVRQELEVFMQNVNASLQEKISQLVQPLDDKFQEKMKPWKDEVAGKFNLKLNSPHFWESHSIFQAG